MPASLILSYMCFHDHNLFVAKCKSELKNPHVSDKVQFYICHDRSPGWTQCDIGPLMTQSDREPVHIKITHFNLYKSLFLCDNGTVCVSIQTINLRKYNRTVCIC